MPSPAIGHSSLTPRPSFPVEALTESPHPGLILSPPRTLMLFMYFCVPVFWVQPPEPSGGGLDGGLDSLRRKFSPRAEIRTGGSAFPGGAFPSRHLLTNPPAPQVAVSGSWVALVLSLSRIPVGTGGHLLRNPTT